MGPFPSSVPSAPMIVWITFTTTPDHLSRLRHPQPNQHGSEYKTDCWILRQHQRRQRRSRQLQQPSQRKRGCKSSDRTVSQNTALKTPAVKLVIFCCTPELLNGTVPLSGQFESELLNVYSNCSKVPLWTPEKLLEL